MLLDWRRLHPDTNQKCKGCKHEYTKHEILCPGCYRDKRDNYKPVKAVEYR